MILDCSAYSEESEGSAGLPMSVPNFRLSDYAGKSHELYERGDAKAVVLFVQGNGCPIVRQSYPYFEALRKDYEAKGVEFLFVNCSAFDEADGVAAEAVEYGVGAPIMLDGDQAFAYAMGFTRTAEAVLVDPRDWSVIYRGMADDRFDYGVQRLNPTEFWLRDALEGHFKGELPEVRRRITKGCLLDFPDLPEQVGYEDEVLPVLERRCLSCHRGKGVKAFGGVGPKTWRGILRDSMLTKRMNWEKCGVAGEAMAFEAEEVRVLSAWLRDFFAIEKD